MEKAGERVYNNTKSCTSVHKIARQEIEGFTHPIKRIYKLGKIYRVITRGDTALPHTFILIYTQIIEMYGKTYFSGFITYR